TKNPSITQVDVRKVRNSKDNKVFEIAKYSAKDSDYLINQEVFEVFYKALKGKRLIVYSGLFKEAMNKFKNGKLDEYKEKDFTRNPSITQVDVRKVRNSKDNKVFEIAKYSAKDSDYLINQEVFEVFYKALKGKRLIVYSGLFKEAMNKFKNGKLDEYKEKDLT